MNLIIFCIGICAIIGPSFQRRPPIRNLTVTHVWKNLEYGFDNPEDEEYALNSKLYSKEGFKRPYDVDVVFHKNGTYTLFISTPRVVRSIPYSLATVSNKMTENGPLLEPFPDFEAHSERDTPGSDRIISVFRIFVDPCERLWAIDTGRNFFASPTQVLPPKILVYDLETNKRLLKYEIPAGQYIPEQTVYNGIIVDIYDRPPHGKCRKGKAYLTDARGYSLLVFDIASQTSWPIFNNLFKPDPAYLNSTIAGETFTFPDGLYTSTPDRKRNRITLHSYASVNEIAAPLNKVNNRSLWENNPSGNQDIFKIIGSRKTQSPTQAMDLKGEKIYFSQLQPLSILTWNPDKPYDQSNFKTVVENQETLQFVAGLKIRKIRGQETLIALSNRLQKLNTGTISLAEDNFRVMMQATCTL